MLGYWSVSHRNIFGIPNRAVDVLPPSLLYRIPRGDLQGPATVCSSTALFGTENGVESGAVRFTVPKAVVWSYKENRQHTAVRNLPISYLSIAPCFLTERR